MSNHKNPSIVGVYKTENGFQNWNGEFWGYFTDTKTGASSPSNSMCWSCFQTPEWTRYTDINPIEEEQKMKIETGKFYMNRGGDKVEVLKTNVGEMETESIIVLDSNNQVIWLWADGRYHQKLDDMFDIVAEYSPWVDVAVDTKVLVHMESTHKWLHRHFSKFVNGKVYVFDGGKTSFTALPTEISVWTETKLAPPQE